MIPLQTAVTAKMKIYKNLKKKEISLFYSDKDLEYVGASGARAVFLSSLFLSFLR